MPRLPFDLLTQISQIYPLGLQRWVKLKAPPEMNEEFKAGIVSYPVAMTAPTFNGG